VSTRDEVLRALREAAPGQVSGEVLAGRLGVSRVAVGKQVSALRALGYGIEARPGAGYRLAGVPDSALPTEVAPLLQDPFWVRVEGGSETASTNDDARVLARAGVPEGTVVVAASQTRGRGRLGRAWSSPSGGAYFSAVLRPGVAPVDATTLPLVVGVGIARGLESLGVGATLKWPNDVLLDEGKVAGVLLELSAEADRVEWVIVGVGLNVRRPEARAAGAAYVADADPSVGVAQAAACVLDAIAATYLGWREEGFGPLRAEYDARHALVGERVVVRDAHGAAQAVGAVIGIDDVGRLVVASDGGVTQAFAAGDVTLVRSSD
jgi:BirA family biotin operon repressor/biotin-[acetyl-CoA-carboxylase] ligase